MLLTVLIPAYNEEESIEATVKSIHETLELARIHHEILVINDYSTDQTSKVLESMENKLTGFRQLNNSFQKGIGGAIKYGLSQYKGDCVAIVMADQSENPKDIVAFFETFKTGRFDCVFGSRFINGGTSSGYPVVKYIFNRLGNQLVNIFFGLNYNDITNAFKLYGRRAIDGIRPIESNYYDITLELPLKSIVKGYSFTVLPNDWVERKKGSTKLKLREMSPKYFRIMWHCWKKR